MATAKKATPKKDEELTTCVLCGLEAKPTYFYKNRNSLLDEHY